LGHIGYSVVPWRRRRGYATSALRQILPLAAQATGLPFVEVTTDAHNIASRRVIERNGGALVEHFVTPPSHGGTAALRFRIRLSAWLPG
jgi:predicted acetyltransferase